MPRVLVVDPRAPASGPINAAVQALLRGELVILPTDTVYGLCAHPARPEAVESIYRVKQRDRNKPLACLAESLQQIRDSGADVSRTAEQVAAAHWPGGLTVVLPVGEDTVGFRVPDHPVPLRIMRELGSALIATSVNRSGEAPALTAPDALACCGDEVAVILDGGPVQGGAASTVIAIRDREIEVLREGAIPASAFGTVSS